jgi:hypothetical protein
MNFIPKRAIAKPGDQGWVWPREQEHTGFCEGKRVSRALAVIFFLLVNVSTGWGYPLDGDQYTGITRLEGYRLAQTGEIRGRRLPAGALLTTEEVDLRLLKRAELRLPEPDPQFSTQVERLLGTETDRYGLAVLDLTDPRRVRYAEHRGKARSNPGSVGKLIVALGVFQALADIYPDDVDARLKVLQHSLVTADEFINSDHHKVPFWDRAAFQLTHRPLRVGDGANLWTYLDWMLSASSNAAASMVIRHLLLLVHFGRDYPVTEARAKSFFQDTPRKELSTLLVHALQDPIPRNGLDLDRLRQGGFFTWKGKQRVPGTTSYATPRELLRFLLRLEQGRLVDVFSSREIKRLLYMTRRRIRYASSPALAKAAVYFKSGSLYKCQAEPDFECGKYRGNVYNWMNSVAIVEAPGAGGRLFYLAVVMSNVLRKNSAVEHQTFATRLHRLIESYHGAEKSE